MTACHACEAVTLQVSTTLCETSSMTTGVPDYTQRLRRPNSCKPLAPLGVDQLASCLHARGALQDKLPDGSTQPIALDFAVIHALGPGHWVATWQSPAGAAEAYSLHKCQHNRTRDLCAQAGMSHQPVVLEKQGGLAVARSNGRAVRRRRITAVDAVPLSARAVGLGP